MAVPAGIVVGNLDALPVGRLRGELAVPGGQVVDQARVGVVSSVDASLPSLGSAARSEGRAPWGGGVMEIAPDELGRDRFLVERTWLKPLVTRVA